MLASSGLHRPCPTWSVGGCAGHGGGEQWGWIVPDGLWELARPSVPPARVRPQGGGVADIDDEAVFAAIVHVLVSGCAWRALPTYLGASKSTVHRRFAIWSRAGVQGRPHRQVLQLLDGQDLIGLSRAVLDPAHVRAERKGGATTGPSPVDRGRPGARMHVLPDANGLPRHVEVSAANVRDSQALKPVLSHFQPLPGRVLRASGRGPAPAGTGLQRRAHADARRRTGDRDRVGSPAAAARPTRPSGRRASRARLLGGAGGQRPRHRRDQARARLPARGPGGAARGVPPDSPRDLTESMACAGRRLQTQKGA
ncbi:IS5 family transposase [Streptomyces griseoviridis]|uniref:IS5 family transposase n=1 Tax=Streptomyces griseoviridis TaxID=45398 RepID=A0A3Q9L1Q0_STRGD|nr:IS5 family transposase [Streptomyces griseoviridis]QCN89010.1 IS5 family transposase [Streptomyces griseoviridis]